MESKKRCSAYTLTEHDPADAISLIKICEILADPVTYSALLSVMIEPKTVAQIWQENNTPLSSTYRAIKNLEQLGLIHIHSYATTNSRRVALYKSSFRSISIKIDGQGGKVDVHKDGRKDSVVG